MSTSKVRIFYPADPLGVVPGGIDTFIRGILKWAPATLEFSLVGMTTDTQARPVGRWTRCQIGQRSFDFFPVVAVGNAGARGRLPLSLRFTAGAWRWHDKLIRDFDVFDFHRPEPSLLFLKDLRPKNAFWHQDPKTISEQGSDNLWRRLPAGYEKLEARAVAQLSSAWCVRATGVTTLRERYPSLDGKVNFLPTWVDAEVFHPADDARRQALRAELAASLGISAAASWIMFVGRLDSQKNPAMLLEAFAKICRRGRDAVLLLVGDGVLKRDLMRQAKAANVADRVHFLGLKPQAEIARLLQAADLFALSSAYEGMPMALLEALGCGTPAVVTDVGEVRRVVKNGSNGMVVPGADAQSFAQALGTALDGAAGWRDAAVAAVARFQPAEVLAPVYANYLMLARDPARARLTAAAQDSAPRVPPRQREAVIGVSIDVMRGSAVVAQIMRWARQRESRTVVFCNVHSTVLARRDNNHALALRSADLVVPDGAPVAWTMRRKGRDGQDRVDGPDTMWRLCAAAREHGVRIGLLGATPQTLEALQAELARRFPGLQVPYATSPPFRELSEIDNQKIRDDVEAAGVGLLFVGLGCPKQERWIAQQRGRLSAVMLGLGAAFDFHAGTVRRAPGWMRDRGLEWLHRLASEPRRLGWRYLSSNTVFLWESLREGLTGGFSGGFKGAGDGAKAGANLRGNSQERGPRGSAVATPGDGLSGDIRRARRRPPVPSPVPSPIRPVFETTADAVLTTAARPPAWAPSATSTLSTTPRTDGAPVRARRSNRADRSQPADAALRDASGATVTAVPVTAAPVTADVQTPPLAPESVFADPVKSSAGEPAARETGGPMSAPAQQRSIADLVARIDAEMPARRSRIVGFLASQRGEGTTTLARAFAQANAETMGRNVLLLSTTLPEGDRPSVIDAVRDGQRMHTAMERVGLGLTEAALGVSNDGRRNAAWSLVASPELWRALRESFELIVVDIKSADASDAAFKVSPLCDGVVVVLEAARTRAPVVTQLLHNLQSVHARVLGTVLNKRRFHLPAKLYRWL